MALYSTLNLWVDISKALHAASKEQMGHLLDSCSNSIQHCQQAVCGWVIVVCYLICDVINCHWTSCTLHTKQCYISICVRPLVRDFDVCCDAIGQLDLVHSILQFVWHQLELR